MELIEKILSEENLQKAIRKVKKNKGAPGVDKMTVQEVEEWFNQYKEDLISKILNKQYKPMPVKRVYIPKPNGKQRPLGIPTVVDRVIQQAMLQVLNEIYEPVFSEHSYGFRTNRSAHMAMEEVLSYLNDGYEWIIDLIFTGRQAIDGDTAQVGPQIAEHLHIPVISYAKEVSVEGDTVRVKRQQIGFLIRS